MNFHNLSSIEIFINNVQERAWSYYQVENAIINGDEKEDILKVIFYDFTKILTELNNMSADSRNVLSSGGLVSFISTLKKFDRKNGFFLSSKLSDKLTKIFNISETINSYVEPLLQLGTNNISDDEDVLQFCPSDANIGQNYQFEYEKQIILKEYREFVEKLTTEIKDKKWINVCGQTTSLNQAVFDYFHQVVATYLKEYVMLYYIDIIDARCLNLNPAPLLMMRQNKSLSELVDSIRLTKVLLNETNSHVYRCDANFKETMLRKPYLQLEGMMQVIVIAESYLSFYGSCNHNCELSQVDSIFYSACDEFKSCLYNHSKYHLCEKDENSSRRYEWIKGKGHTAYGNNYPFCDGKKKIVKSIYSPDQVRYCDFCMCTCIKRNPTSVHTVTAISFREQVTDITKNKVAVGVRFVESGNMIHVQIKEKDFTSNEAGVWKSLEDVYFHKLERTFYVTTHNLNFYDMKLSRDYAHPQAIAFDDLMAPKGFVVTGVRFRFAGDSAEDPKNTGLIQLQIRVTPFDYVNRKLINLNETRWIVPTYLGSRNKLDLTHPDMPTKSPLNVIDSKTNQYAKFQTSDLVKDAGQSTMPFFDAQNVEGEIDFPLGGIGLFHRGHEGYGGFLAFKIYDMNLSKLFQERSNFL
ncbi:uncharacterized protein LOC123265961 [Cotesia glomerata]|uniref:uncharacterized protein LOC123265961 n=1 Tax=Cotesia glomerata TaxID=32391 RepID=UPI001D0049C2|nr:uncharacterized protein LOC123265961 [Cotesia glomerata]